MATDPVVLAMPGTRKAGAGMNEGGSLNRKAVELFHISVFLNKNYAGKSEKI